MLFRAGSCRAMPRMLSSTWLTGGRALPSVLPPAGPERHPSVTWWMRMLSIFSTGFIICETISEQLVEPVALQFHFHQVVAASVLRGEPCLVSLRLCQQPQALCISAGANRLRVGLGALDHHGSLGVGFGGLDLSLLLHALDGHFPRAICYCAFALGLDMFLREHDLGARALCLCLRFRLLCAFAGEPD